MTLAEALLAILLSLPPHVSDQDEPAELRRARLSEVATAIAGASRGDRQTAAALLTLGWHESRWARYVGAGCADVPEGHADCDGGRARSYWQVWAQGCRSGWELAPGSREALTAFADCAGRLWRSALHRCTEADQDPLFGAYSGYRSACFWEPARKRAAWHRRVLGRL